MDKNQGQEPSFSKTCVICGQDCSKRPRVKDQRGRYYCKACHEKRREANVHDSDIPRAVVPSVSPSATPHPSQPADDLIPFADESEGIPDRATSVVSAAPSRPPGESDMRVAIQHDGAETRDDQGYEEVWTAPGQGVHQGGLRTGLGTQERPARDATQDAKAKQAAPLLAAPSGGDRRLGLGVLMVAAGFVMAIANGIMAWLFWGQIERGMMHLGAGPLMGERGLVAVVGWETICGAAAAFLGIGVAVLMLLTGIWLTVSKRTLCYLGLLALAGTWLHACLWIHGITEPLRRSGRAPSGDLPVLILAVPLLWSAGAFLILTRYLCRRPDTEVPRRALDNLLQPFVLLCIAVGWGTVLIGISRWSIGLKQLGDVSLLGGIDPMLLLYGYGLMAPILGGLLGFAALILSRRDRNVVAELTQIQPGLESLKVVMIALASILGLVEATILTGSLFAKGRDPWAISLVTGLIEVLFAVVIPAAFVYMTYGKGVRRIWGSETSQAQRVAIAVVLGLIMAFAAGLVEYAAKGIFQPMPKQALKWILSADDPLGWARVLVFVVVIPAICEEYLFRGMLFRGLAQRVSSPAAAVLSSLAFALAHFALPDAIVLFLVGLVLAWIVAYTKSIRPCIVVHGLVNLAAVIQVNGFAS